MIFLTPLEDYQWKTKLSKPTPLRYWLYHLLHQNTSLKILHPPAPILTCCPWRVRAQSSLNVSWIGILHKQPNSCMVRYTKNSWCFFCHPWMKNIRTSQIRSSPQVWVNEKLIETATYSRIRFSGHLQTCGMTKVALQNFSVDLLVSWRVLSHRLLAVTDQRFFVGHLGIKSSRRWMAAMASALVLMGLMRSPDLKAYNSQNMGNQRDSI